MGCAGCYLFAAGVCIFHYGLLRKLQAIATHLKVVLTGPSLLVLVVCDVVWRTHFSDLDGTFTIGALASVLRTFCFVAVAMVVVVVLDGPPEVPRWMCLALVLGVANTASTLVSWDRLVVARVWNVEVVLKDFYLSTYSQLLLVFLSITTLLSCSLRRHHQPQSQCCHACAACEGHDAPNQLVDTDTGVGAEDPGEGSVSTSTPESLLPSR